VLLVFVTIVLTMLVVFHFETVLPFSCLMTLDYFKSVEKREAIQHFYSQLSMRSKDQSY